jgi:crossover junction endodeoxyribonuclease RuvC
VRVLGLDPGLVRTGWGVIEVHGSLLRHVASGAVTTGSGGDLARRLLALHDGLARVIALHRPEEAAVERSFVNTNHESTLKLGHARGVVLLAAAGAGLEVAEYATKLVKKAVVGTGSATKEQVGMMVRQLLPGSAPESWDAADALAVAICHAHRASARRLAEVAEGALRKPARRGPATGRRRPLGVA